METERFLQEGLPNSMSPASIVRYGDLFSDFDRSDRVNGFMFCIAIPVVVRIWEATMINEARRGVDPAHMRAASTG